MEGRGEEEVEETVADNDPLEIIDHRRLAECPEDEFPENIAEYFEFKCVLGVTVEKWLLLARGCL